MVHIWRSENNVQLLSSRGSPDGTQDFETGSLYTLGRLLTLSELHRMSTCKVKGAKPSMWTAQWISNRKDQLKSLAYSEALTRDRKLKQPKKKSVFPFRDTFPVVQWHSHPREEIHPLKWICAD